MQQLKRILNSPITLVASLILLLFLMLFVKHISFEPIEVGNIKQILNPVAAWGTLSYDPHLNYDYIIAFVAEKIGYKDNFTQLAALFWFLEMLLAVGALTALCNFIFKNDKMILVMVVAFFILAPSGQIDQKTMAVPLYLFAIYYFLKEKWFISALFGAAIFYLHVGLAIWWFLSSCFALAIIFLIQKRIAIKQIIGYPLMVIIGAFPIIYFYLARVSTAQRDPFLIKYYYYKCWSSSSLLMSLSNRPWIVSTLIMLAIILVGYTRAKQAGYKINNIMPLLVGVFILYLVNFVFADILLNATVITLQLQRSIVYVEFFSALFFAFLLAGQIKNGNYVFFLIFILFFCRHSVLGRLLRGINYYDALNLFYIALLIYMMLEKHLLYFFEKIRSLLAKKNDTNYFQMIVKKNNQLLKQPVAIAILLIFLVTPKFAATSYYIKFILNIPQNENTVELARYKSLYEDIIRFTNEKIGDQNAVLIVPFHEGSFEYYTKHKIFITYEMPLSQVVYDNKKYNFKDVLENGLDYSPELLFENYSDESFYRQWMSLWINLDEDTIKCLKKKYKVTHVIREKEFPLKFPILYQNKFYKVYEIR